MFQDGPVNRIDEIICKIRREISKVAEDFNSTIDDLIEFISVSNRDEYNSVIDSLYLLEDTQLAKHSFAQESLSHEEFGRLYLLYYGVLNSCYMQQQAILVICDKLGIKDNIKELKNSEIICFRNDFTAHSSNRGRGVNEHSYILDRFAMREGKLKGYTLNHKEGEIFKEEEISSLINNWDRLLERQLELVAVRIRGTETAS
jgi:DNA primase large subunit